jgi:5-oxoprolinase (ATP-hydrolysing)
MKGRRDEGAAAMTRPPPLADPVRLELFTNRFSAIARDMGEVLRRSALSTNIKERLDFSCALLDPGGSLVVNAPHIPVHLGALGLCVRRVAAAVEMAPGDVVVTNHPGYGGSHLPDVTVITPVFAAGDAVEADGGAGGAPPQGREGEADGAVGARSGGGADREPAAAAGGWPRLLGYAASRAHHAEIGGCRPGSMPPDATRLVDEGVVLPPVHLIRGGEPRWDELRRRLEAPPWPSRAPEENLADLAAAVAANRRGAEALARLAAVEGSDVVAAAMAGLEARAEALLRRALARLAAERPGRMQAEDRLDDGSPLRVAVELLGAGSADATGGAAGLGSGTGAGASTEPLEAVADAPEIRIDFTGSAPVHPGNLNATPAIVRSVVLYVLRLLVGEPLPLNEGLARPVELIVPEGILSPPFVDDPRRCPAVVGGNVETSQRLVDVLLAALGLAAGSQGTMNNVLFGGAGFAYYETVAGGCGAGPGFTGASAVHSHMTNTRATDPEVLERRYPVRLDRFAVRRGSGGAGRWPGGDGIVREMTFLAPLTLSLLTQHRTTAPRGAAGGSPGTPGRQRLLRAAGETEDLPPIAGREVLPGDRLILETPGGGGWGAPDADSGPGPQPKEEPPDAQRGRRRAVPGVVEERPTQPSAERPPPVEGAPRPGAPPPTLHERAPCPGDRPPPPPRALPLPPPPLPEPPP